MNILVFNGSPKGSRSNTVKLTQSFLAGVSISEITSGHGEPSIEMLDISQLDIHACIGCFSCWKKTPGSCVFHDDMDGVIEKILWADLIIWSFPLYYYNVPGQLKTLIDRQLPMLLPFMNQTDSSGGHPARFDLSAKKTVIISTCGLYTPIGNYDSVFAMFDRMVGKGMYESIVCAQGELFSIPELSARTNAYLGTVQQAGAEYAHGGITGRTRTALEEPLYERSVFEKMADASWGIDAEGQAVDESLVFTRKMAALYNKSSYPGHDIIIDMVYTDAGTSWRVVLGKEGSTVVDVGDAPYTTRITTPLAVWQAISRGELSGPDAMMQHKYSVEGDFDIMLHWGDYFGASGGQVPVEPEHSKQAGKRTNMVVLLAPWIAFWVAAAINSFWGSIASLGVCLLVPLASLVFLMTPYDLVSVLLVGLSSISLLVGAPPLIVIPLSYLLFGLMWGISCFCKVPLTAWYSMYSGYGGPVALQNSLFVKTNRILTAIWSILYLVTPIWTYFLMRTSAGMYVGAINAVFPAVLGLFTIWFQKWYPAHVARGR